ncbi:DegT/DnrJ/EryC1/StrS family aminotransferase [Winogradskyella sp. UBA3174]|uniref:DegT/DnrJ/EryC1/StrS family aminotransferase n=1 Tax=Winogradskyella sp. UBA3174 TaxID=1947785 RepID=UPI0025FC305D|nr:DegT/DnrJ/EryC1/StrS family aminotransferase [Winogradskyella sp. UBA3174]|tara:strand:- start:36758 stop:37855 length:1098 start_codon:yes stop_codon:yes gene_type:complete
MIKFLDLHKINQRFHTEFEAAFKQSLKESHYILGKNVTKFENAFANYCGTQYCIGTANGLDALTLILKGYIHLGKLEKGDKVIVPANTFIATVLSVIHAGLEPVFIEPNSQTYNLSLENIKQHYTSKIKVVIMVHLYGQIADVENISEFARQNNLLLIEDAAQAHGAESVTGRTGNLSNAAAFSFYPSKNLGALGDGGAVTTNDSTLNDAIRLLRNYGSKEKYNNQIVGFNSRLDEIQASFLNIKLSTLDSDNQRRRHIAKTYLDSIINHKIQLPNYNGSKNHVFYAFVVEVDDRADFSKYLDNNAVEWLIHYPIPPHKQRALVSFSHLNLPITEKIHKRIISLPISPVMSNEDVQNVIQVLNKY